MSIIESICSIEVGEGPLVATAIHDGHEVRPAVADNLALNAAERRREEDPYTALWTAVAPTRVVGTRSRFEVDLNRPREKAVYMEPEDAWGLQVWKSRLPDDEALTSLHAYDAFYDDLREVYATKASQHGAFVVYDLHTYNHRRQGPNHPAADVETHPQVNIGTGTLADRERFGPVVDRLIHDLRNFDFPGGRLDVRENVKFFGGNHPSWTHRTFPDSACVIAIECKKFFMDEWSGEPNMSLVEALGQALAATVPGVLDRLAERGAVAKS